MIARTTCISIAVLIAIAALSTAGFATAGDRPNSSPASGPAWADASQNGQLSDNGRESAENYLKNKYGKYIDKGKKASKRKVKR